MGHAHEQGTLPETPFRSKPDQELELYPHGNLGNVVKEEANRILPRLPF